MIDPELAAFAGDGRALIVGTVDDSGAPNATRGWGLRLADDGVLRLVLDADDERAVVDLAAGRLVAVTAADVRTLESKQFKGTSAGIVEMDDDDLAAHHHYLEEFFGAIEATDGTERWVTARATPSRFVTCLFACDEVYDQTPGPAAGGTVSGTG